ncbi:hypothetical protein J1D01_13880 [Seonamhaeicola sp. NFXS20]|uniref:hypothetical protein n=1 Tax=Seonamhaeicola sp. NFXS20 TaxID=2816959 RepID=UPI003B8AB234
MKFLIIVQDLRVSGTSAGIGRRSFLGKLRRVYPDAKIDVHYIIHRDTEDQLDLLPINSIKKHIVNTKVPWHIIFLNRFYWRLFHISLKERYVHKQYAKVIEKLDYKVYDHIFITSSGLEHETILATYNLPILKKAILVFHDPYPLSWYVGSDKKPSKLDLFRLNKMIEVVHQAKTCATTANYMSQDLQHLYASKKKFYTLPHQFDADVFDLLDTSQVIKKNKKVRLSYNGAFMFGRNPDNMLMAYKALVNENPIYKEHTEFVLRVKGEGIENLKQKFKEIKNIKILETLNFSNAFNEQINESDIVIILENGPIYCNILVGKAPFLAAYNKPLLCISPEKSELRNIIVDKRCIANMNDIADIKEKLNVLINNRLTTDEIFKPFGDYFSNEKFKERLEKILKDKND